MLYFFAHPTETIFMHTMDASQIRPGQTLHIGEVALAVLSAVVTSEGVALSLARVLMNGQPMVGTYVVSGKVRVS